MNIGRSSNLLTTVPTILLFKILGMKKLFSLVHLETTVKSCKPTQSQHYLHSVSLNLVVTTFLFYMAADLSRALNFGFTALVRKSQIMSSFPYLKKPHIQRPS